MVLSCVWQRSFFSFFFMRLSENNTTFFDRCALWVILLEFRRMLQGCMQLSMWLSGHFEKISEFLSERFSREWIRKPQFWCPPPRFASQRRIPEPLFWLSGYTPLVLVVLLLPVLLPLLSHCDPYFYPYCTANPYFLSGSRALLWPHFKSSGFFGGGQTCNN